MKAACQFLCVGCEQPVLHLQAPVFCPEPVINPGAPRVWSTLLVDGRLLNLTLEGFRRELLRPFCTTCVMLEFLRVAMAAALNINAELPPQIQRRLRPVL